MRPRMRYADLGSILSCLFMFMVKSLAKHAFFLLSLSRVEDIFVEDPLLS